MEQEMKALMEQKDELEKHLKQLNEEISAIDSEKMYSKGVVDREGFPRQDLDFGSLANYRNLKRKQAELNNDHFALMKKIEKGLFQLHQTYPKVQEEIRENKEVGNPQALSKESPKTTKQQETKEEYKIEYLTPFAILSEVASHSPAQKGGLLVGDLLSTFGQITIYTLDNIKQIPTVVKEDKPIKISVMREVQGEGQGYKVFEGKDGKKWRRMDLEVIPTRWVGRGLLGCKIDPF